MRQQVRTIAKNVCLPRLKMQFKDEESHICKQNLKYQITHWRNLTAKKRHPEANSLNQPQSLQI